MTTTNVKRWLLALGLAAFVGCKSDARDQPAADPLDDPWVDAIDTGDAEPEPTPEEPGDPSAADPGVAEVVGETGLAAAGTDASAGEGAAETDAEAKAAGEGALAAKTESSGAAAKASDEPAPAPSPEAEASASDEPAAEPSPPPTPSAEPAPAPEPAPPPAPPPITAADFDGSFRYAGGSSQRSDLADAIEHTVEQLSAMIQGMARRRLTEANEVDKTIDISISGDKITTSFASGLKLTCVIDGSAVRTKGTGGERLDVRVRAKGSKLVQHLQGKQGARTIVYVLSKDRKRLTVHHKITAKRLPEPLTYRLSYSRK